MPQTAAAVVSQELTLRNLPFLQSIWQGGNMAFVDKATNGVKQGYLSIIGNITPTGSGASNSSKVKSAEFIQAMATGVGVAAGEPISQLDPMIQVKVNAPSVLTLAQLLFSTAPTQVTQAAVSTDTQKIIETAVLDVWYPIGVESITKLDASIDASGTFTDLVNGTDYLLDTETGWIMFPSATTQVTAGEEISILYQCAAITNAPQIAPGALPRFGYGGVYIYSVLAANESRNNTESWLRYIPMCRIKPSGNFDISVDKPAEVTLDFSAVPSNEISGLPYGYLKQIAGTARSIS